MKTKKATFAIYKNKAEIRTAIKSLLRLGFKDRSLAVMQPVLHGAKDFPQVQKNQLTNGAVFGAILGAFIAGGLYLFFGSDMNSHSVGVDTTAFRGTVAAAVAILLGAIAGAASGALVGIGTPDRLGKRYGQYMHSGGILLSVESDSDEQAKRAEEILMATGGQDVHVANEKMTWDSAIMENIEISQGNLKNVLQAYT